MIETFTAWAQEHNQLALTLIFFVALLDCLFLIGLVFISAPFLFGAGALVALGAFEFWPVVLTIAGGGLAGDIVSYFLGRHYGVALFRAAFFAKRPALIDRGRRFFSKHGGKGLIVAHNIGVLRPLLPTVAGVYGLTPLRFLLAIVPAALFWAFLCTVLGLGFGASMGLAAEVTQRLAILILSVAALLWLTLWLTWLLARAAQGRAQAWLGALLDLSRHHRILGKLGPALADPEQPETPALALFASILLLLGAVILLLIWGVAPREQPPGADLWMFQNLFNLTEPWTTNFAVLLSLLGEWPVYLPYAAAALAMLIWVRNRRAAAHWVAALLFGAAITVGLGLIPNISNPLEYSGLVSNSHFPRDLVMTTVIYGFTPVLLLSGTVHQPRTAPYAVMFVCLLLLVLARLYLGTLWFSVGVVAVLTGLFWVGALGLGYRRHAPQKIPLLRFAPALAVLALASVWHVQSHFDERQALHTPAPVRKSLDAGNWWQHDWVKLRARRQDLAGNEQQFLNLQWAGPLEDIHQTLLRTGWQAPQELKLTTALQWLSSDAPIPDLPVLPRYHAGHHEVLQLRRDIDADHQYLLRLWPSGYVLDDEQPLWTGSLVQQEARPVFRALRYPVNENIYTAALESLQLPLRGYASQRVQRGGASYTLLLLRPSQTPTDALKSLENSSPAPP